MIEVHLLRYALAAADFGSFSRAADQFGIKQSTLSKRVQYLELRLGLPLFRRSTRGVTPTDTGERFLSKARRIVQDIEALDQESRALASGAAGGLRIGFHSSLGGGNLAAVLREYRSAWPGVEIDAREDDGTRLLEAVEDGRLDLAIVTGRSSRTSLRSLCFWSEPLVIGLPPGHPLADMQTLYWTDLRHAEFVVTAADPGPDLAAMIIARLSGPGHRPAITAQQVSRDNLLSLAAGDRLTVTAGVAPAAAGADLPTLREVHDAFGATTLEQGVHWRRDNTNPALKRFLELLSHRYARPIPKD
ncbi:MAG: LysR family transcriptional regulator [Sphingomonas sp.]